MASDLSCRINGHLLAHHSGLGHDKDNSKMNYVMWQGIKIMKGSDAFELYHDQGKKNGKAIFEAHMAQLEKNRIKLEGK